LSGACGGRYTGDISLPLLGIDRRVEVKVREHGFETIYRWLAGNDALIIRKNREPALVVTRLSFAVEVARTAEPRKSVLGDLKAVSAALSMIYREIDDGRRGGPLAAACNVELLHELVTRAETLIDGVKSRLS